MDDYSRIAMTVYRRRITKTARPERTVIKSACGWLRNWVYFDRECVGTREIGVAKSIDGPSNDCRAEVAIGVIVMVHCEATIKVRVDGILTTGNLSWVHDAAKNLS